MQFLFFVDANTLPLSFLYHEYVSKLMHDINNNNNPLSVLLHEIKNSILNYSVNTNGY